MTSECVAPSLWSSRKLSGKEQDSMESRPRQAYQREAGFVRCAFIWVASAHWLMHEQMVRGDTLLALAVAETTPVNEVDIMLPVVVNIFDTKLNLLALLKAVIEREVTRSGKYTCNRRETSSDAPNQRTPLSCSERILWGRDSLQQWPKCMATITCGRFSTRWYNRCYSFHQKSPFSWIRGKRP